MRTKKFIILCGFVAILLSAGVLSACNGSKNAEETLPSASAEASTETPENTPPADEYQEILPTPSDWTPDSGKPTATTAPTPTKTPASTGTSNGLIAATDDSNQNWGPLS